LIFALGAGLAGLEAGAQSLAYVISTSTAQGLKITRVQG